MITWKLQKKELEKSEIKRILFTLSTDSLYDELIVDQNYFINRHIVDDTLYYVHVTSAVTWKICIYRRIRTND